MEAQQFVQLANGDLWRGFVADERADNVAPLDADSSEDAVMQMIGSQRGETISCVWCGQQFARKQLTEIREHVETQHSKSLLSVDDAAALAREAFDPSKADIIA